MADFTAHYLFGGEMLSLCETSVRDVSQRDINAFNWGLQGPDPLLFHNFSVKNQEYNKYSSLMHTIRTDALLLKMADYIRDRGDPSLTAYFFGMLGHYCLDRRIHPYVYYTQLQLEKADIKWKRSAHILIECQLDKYFWGKLRNTDINNFRVRSVYKKDSRLFSSLGVMFDYLLRDIYGVSPDVKILEKCFDEVLEITPFFYSKTGFFYHGCKMFDSVLGLGGKAIGHVKRVSSEYDFSNDDHSPWFNIWHPEKTMTDSAMDIFTRARDESVSIASAFMKYFQGDPSHIDRLHLAIPFSNGCPQNDWYNMLTMY